MPRPRATGEWELKRRTGRAGWHAYRNIGGKPQWISLEAKSEARARQAIADLERETEQHTAKRLTVRMLLDSYLENRKGRVTAYSRLKEALVPLKRELGHYRPDQMDQKRWDKYVVGRAHHKTRLPISAGTLRRERNVLVAAFNLAKLALDIVPPQAPPARQRYLSRQEADRLLTAFVSNHARLLYTLCLYTGCRKGQALALTWDRVDFSANRIDFNEPGRPITVKRRAVVPMGQKLRAVIEEAYRIRTTDQVIEWGGKAAKRVRWPFRRARERAGLGKEVTPHVLRHTAASWLAMQGIPIDKAADLLACDPATLRRVYRHFDPDYLADAVKALEGE